MAKDTVKGMERLLQCPEPNMPSAGERVYLDINVGGIIAGAEERGLDLAVAGSLANTSALVGLNVVVSPVGALGTWRCAIFGKTVFSVASPQGYLDAAEFELNIGAVVVNPEYNVLSLNLIDNGLNPQNCAPHSAYIAFHNYGTNPARAVLYFDGDTVQAHDLTSLLCSTSNLATTHTMRILVGDTPYWILMSNTGPAA
jgi:hypothetical protein